jgi:hypothetical protein
VVEVAARRLGGAAGGSGGGVVEVAAAACGEVGVWGGRADAWRWGEICLAQDVPTAPYPPSLPCGLLCRAAKVLCRAGKLCRAQQCLCRAAGFFAVRLRTAKHFFFIFTTSITLRILIVNYQ